MKLVEIISGKSRWRLVCYYVLAVVVYYIWFQAFYNMVAYGRLFDYDDIPDAIGSITRNFLPITAVFISNTFIIFRLTRRVGTLVKLVYDLALSIVVAVVVSLLARLVMEGVGAPTDFDWAGIILNDMIIYLVNELVFLFYSSYETMKKAERAEHTALQLQYDVLKAQVDPHFLFNSLNILYSMSVIDIDKTRQFILSLSQMYRYILTQRDKHSVRLSEEMAFLKSYIDILEQRYRDCLTFVIDGLENIADHEIVPYSTQLLIENVTKHNIINIDNPMCVTIVIGAEELSICNPIKKKKVTTSSRIGLRYVSELYNYHGKKFRYIADESTFTAYVPYL